MIRLAPEPTEPWAKMKGFIEVVASDRALVEDSLAEDTETRGWAIEAASRHIIELDDEDDLSSGMQDNSTPPHMELLKELQTLHGFLGCAIYSARENEVTIVSVKEQRESISQLILETYKLFERKQMAIHLMDIDERIEEFILTFEQTCCLVKAFGPGRSDFVCVVLDRASGNLAIARLSLIQLGART